MAVSQGIHSKAIYFESCWPGRLSWQVGKNCRATHFTAANIDHKLVGSRLETGITPFGTCCWLRRVHVVFVTIPFGHNVFWMNKCTNTYPIGENSWWNCPYTFLSEDSASIDQWIQDEFAEMLKQALYACMQLESTQRSVFVELVIPSVNSWSRIRVLGINSRKHKRSFCWIKLCRCTSSGISFSAKFLSPPEAA